MNTQALNLPNSTEARRDDDAQFKRLTKRVQFAWPTFGLLLLAVSVFTLSSTLYFMEAMPLLLMLTLNAFASFWAFTVGHDASHNAVSTNKSLNDWIGRASILLLSPVPFFRMFRYIHMQHHRFANDPTQDPDFYCGTGPKWTLPLRWATLDLHYFTIYLRPSVFKKRPKSEQREFVVAIAWTLLSLSAIAASGLWLEYLLVFLIPTRIATFFLAFAFDFLPHYPHSSLAKDAPYQATVNRVGAEWLLTPLMLSQNYHLVHHLYPTVPFYRYLAVWKAKESHHMAQNPAIVDAFSLRKSGEQQTSQ